MLSRWKHAVVSLVGVSLALAGCDSGGDADDNANGNGNGNGGSESAPADDPTEIEPVWTEDLEVVSGPRQAGDTALVYVSEGRDLYLVGVDIDSGDELWRQAASPGEVVNGIAVVPRVVDGHPVYFRPSDVGNLYAELVVADPETGEDVVATDPYLFRSTPKACDDERAICLQVAEDPDDTSDWQRLEIDGDGSFVPDQGLETRPGRQIRSPGLLDVEQDGTEYLAVYEDGEELWRRPVSELFSEGYSPDVGWSWVYDERTDLFTGRLDFESEDDGQGGSVYDLSRFTIVAIERATGQVAWEDEGVMHLCHNTLQMPTDEKLELSAAGEDVSMHPVPVRCRVQGTVTTHEDEDTQREGVDVTLEGYEPETGETTWSLHLGAERSLIGWFGGDEPVTLLDNTSALVSMEGEPTVVDLQTGETRPADDETMWCTVPDSHMFEYREPYMLSDDEPSHQRVGEDLREWCDASGESVDASGPAPTGVPNAFGVRSDDHAVVATPDGLVGYGTHG